MAVVETDAIIADLTGTVAVIDRAQQQATSAAEYVGQVAGHAAATGMAGVATALTGIRQQVKGLSTALADAAGAGREAVAAVRAVWGQTSPAEVGQRLTIAVQRLDAMRSALVAVAQQIATIKARVEVVLRGAQPGPILNRLDSLREYLVAAVGRGDAAKTKIEDAIATTRGLGTPAGPAGSAAPSAPADHVVPTGFVRTTPSPAAVAEIRPYVGRDIAVGRLYDPSGRPLTPLVGPGDPTAADQLTQPRASMRFASHVEAGATARMRRDGIRHAVLYLNMRPCLGDDGCTINISATLPPGSRLTVYQVRPTGGVRVWQFDGTGEGIHPR